MANVKNEQARESATRTPEAAPEGRTAAPAPGGLSPVQLKRRLVQRRARPEDPVQRRGEAGALDDSAVHEAASHGIEGSTSAMPFGGEIQRAFGHHDVSGIQAHVGGEAAAGAQAMGAEAFATGNHVAFAGAPSLHTAAHEAAHVVQQRAGVQLAGGVGAEGDPYEQHADQVADAVVAGDSAEALLDQHAGAGGVAATPAMGGVQRKISVGKEQLEYADHQHAFAALKSTFPGARPDLLLYHLSVLHRTDAKFQNFATLKHDLTGRLARDLTETEQTELRQLGTMDRTQQSFGADVGYYTSPEAALEIFKGALKGGARLFDAATFYRLSGGDMNSLAPLMEAAKQCGIPASELHVIYKVLPPDPARKIEDPIETQVLKAAAALSQFPDVLMLHEVNDLEAGKADLLTLIQFVRAGKGKAIGVSNVAPIYLELLYAYSVEEGCPIRFVQNRFNPYHQDTEIRAFCTAHAIQYMGYSVLGSAQKGVCHDDGQGAPAQFLVPLQDPRLIALATREHIGTGDMLLAWTHQKGVSSVAYSDKGQERVASNLAASHKPLSAAVMAEIDAMVSDAPRADARDFGGKAGLAKLYGALPDPTAWYLMDQLSTVANGGDLLDEIATNIVGANPGAVAQKEKLANFAQNLLRFAADLQSPANKRAQTWLEVMKTQFAALAAAVGTESVKVGDLCLEWANKNSEQGGHAQNAIQDIEGIISGTYVPTRPITQTGRDNQPRVVAPVAVVAAVSPPIGTVLQLTAMQAPKFFHPETYAETAFAAVGPGIYNINYLGQFNIAVNVTATLADTVTATVVPTPE